MRTIRVTGKGMIKVHPDMTRLIITLEGIYRDYAETLRRSAEDTEQMKDTLEPFGIKRTDLKTLNFDIDTQYESYKEKDTYKKRLIGYKYTHMLKLEFESDNKRLGKILYAVANCQLQPEFRISYTVKDPEAIKNKLLGKAIKDAKEKAAVLSKAAGVELKEIQDINYSWGQVKFEYEPLENGMFLQPEIMYEKSYDIDIEPDDIDASDTVTVIWEIA